MVARALVPPPQSAQWDFQARRLDRKGAAIAKIVPQIGAGKGVVTKETTLSAVPKPKTSAIGARSINQVPVREKLKKVNSEPVLTDGTAVTKPLFYWHLGEVATEGEELRKSYWRKGWDSNPR
jgi:hypothetical protein